MAFNKLKLKFFYWKLADVFFFIDRGTQYIPVCRGLRGKKNAKFLTVSEIFDVKNLEVHESLVDMVKIQS